MTLVLFLKTATTLGACIAKVGKNMTHAEAKKSASTRKLDWSWCSALVLLTTALLYQSKMSPPIVEKGHCRFRNHVQHKEVKKKTKKRIASSGTKSTFGLSTSVDLLTCFFVFRFPFSLAVISNAAYFERFEKGHFALITTLFQRQECKDSFV